MVGENVYKIVKDFQDAIAADQVREVDKVKNLMQLLNPIPYGGGGVFPPPNRYR